MAKNTLTQKMTEPKINLVRIDSTLIYIQLDKSLFQNLPDDSFIIRAAHSLEEAVKLGEVGFEPFVVMEGVQLFRKRK